MLLSILICSIPERAESLKWLEDELSRQIEENNLHDIVEVISYVVPKGQQTIGENRNYLKWKAQGEYICFFDDDDKPSISYLQVIMTALTNKPDIVTFTMVMYENGIHTKTFRINVFGGEGGDGKPFYNINRCFFHLCPHKKSIADKAIFPDKDFMEDAEYTERIRPYIKTEAHIHEAIYYYYKITKPIQHEHGLRRTRF